MDRKEGSRKPRRTAGLRRPLTLVYLISRLGVGDGKRCRDAMRAAGSAFTSPGISILLEVMVAGRGLARPRRGLCARSAGRGRARLYIGRCQAGAFLIGREGRGAGGWSILPRTPGHSPDLHKARRPRRAARSLGAHGQVWPATPRPRARAHAHPAAGLDGQGRNPRRDRAGLGERDRPRPGTGGSGGGGRTLADGGRGSWPQKQSGQGADEGGFRGAEGGSWGLGRGWGGSGAPPTRVPCPAEHAFLFSPRDPGDALSSPSWAGWPGTRPLPTAESEARHGRRVPDG